MQGRPERVARGRENLAALRWSRGKDLVLLPFTWPHDHGASALTELDRALARANYAGTSFLAQPQKMMGTSVRLAAVNVWRRHAARGESTVGYDETAEATSWNI